MNPLAIALQGIGFGPKFVALQGFVFQISELYEKYVSTIYKLNSFSVIYKEIDRNIVYRVKSATEVDL
jgi:hypothetical protein